MARYGYARVSTDTQSVDAQLPALEAEKLDMIFVETVSGAVPARERPVLASLLDRLQPDDSLVVVRLDRLGRDAIDMLQLVSALDERDIRVRILALGIETGTANGRLFLTILMAIAEFERELIRERTRAGIAAARAAGRRIGRPRALTPAQTRHVRALAAQGLSIRDIASVMNVGPPPCIERCRARLDRSGLGNPPAPLPSLTLGGAVASVTGPLHQRETCQTAGGDKRNPVAAIP